MIARDRCPPPTAVGRLAAGDRSKTSPNPLAGEKRYLTVGGGHRKSAEQAVGGDEATLKKVLVAAEAAGIGQAC